MQICLNHTLLRVLDQSSGKKLEENLGRCGLTTEAFLKMLKTKMASPEMTRLIERKIKQYINEKEESLAISFLTHFSSYINIEKKDAAGRTFLLFAIKKECKKVAKYLIKNKADLYAQDHYQHNAKDYATAHLYDDFLRLPSDQISSMEESLWLAHVWGLSATIKIGVLWVNPETGFHGDDGRRRVAQTALDYLNHCRQIQTEHPLKEMNIDTIEKCLEAFYSQKGVVSQIVPNTPTIITAKWWEHSAYAFIGRKWRVMKCNRGELCGVSGVRMYQMNSLIHMKYVVDELQKTDKFINHRSFFRFLDLTHIRDVPQKEQPGENCCVESGKAANYALYIDEALETYPEESTALAKAKIAYKDYTVYARLKTLENYLAKSPAYDFALLKRIKDKSIDLENRKSYWKGQSVKVLSLFAKNPITNARI